MLEDDEYLSAPVTGSAQWLYRPDLDHSPMECSLENARRHLEQ